MTLNGVGEKDYAATRLRMAVPGTSAKYWGARARPRGRRRRGARRGYRRQATEMCCETAGWVIISFRATSTCPQSGRRRVCTHTSQVAGDRRTSSRVIRTPLITIALITDGRNISAVFLTLGGLGISRIGFSKTDHTRNTRTRFLLTNSLRVLKCLSIHHRHADPSFHTSDWPSQRIGASKSMSPRRACQYR